ncbi:hypothetical protein ACP70R_029396 [Stipagrostis hirtigluma subsp. patula]
MGHSNARVEIGGDGKVPNAMNSNKKMKSHENLTRRGTLSQTYEHEIGSQEDSEYNVCPMFKRISNYRSKSERMRRTRISEKLRKLQALVPNMSKQTTTADMLDSAIEHIKELETKLQALKEQEEKCSCQSKSKIKKMQG